MNSCGGEQIPPFSGSETQLDAAGIFRRPGESPEAFQTRIRLISGYLRPTEDLPELYALMNDSPAVPDGAVSAAAEDVQKLYGFSPSWVPCRFNSGQTGHFSAGVLLEIDNAFPLICIHDSFQKSPSHFGYTLRETLAHEMVHAARLGFPPSAYEEFFPCQVHRRAFRRLTGNLFRTWKIPVLFTAGCTAGILGVLPEYRLLALFWLLPCAILIREWYLHRILHHAAVFLRKCGLRPMPVMVRMTDSEIRLAAKGRLERDFSRFAE